METDLYELLGVSRDADAATLKSAYRKLAMKHHPDRNPGDAEAEAQFKAVGAAYEVLKDPQKRAAYDQYGHAAFQQGGPGGFSGQGDFGDIGDIFETIFGQAFGGGGGPTDTQQMIFGYPRPQYVDSQGQAWLPATESMFTITPLSAACMTGSSCIIAKATPFRFVFTRSRYSSTVRS